jgi:hypothetical protein
MAPPLRGPRRYPYSPKLRVANDSPRGPLLCLHTLLVDSSKNKLLLIFTFALLGSNSILATFRWAKLQNCEVNNVWNVNHNPKGITKSSVGHQGPPTKNVLNGLSHRFWSSWLWVLFGVYSVITLGLLDSSLFNIQWDLKNGPTPGRPQVVPLQPQTESGKWKS